MEKSCSLYMIKNSTFSVKNFLLVKFFIYITLFLQDLFSIFSLILFNTRKYNFVIALEEKKRKREREKVRECNVFKKKIC